MRGQWHVCYGNGLSIIINSDTVLGLYNNHFSQAHTYTMSKIYSIHNEYAQVYLVI